MKTTTFLVTLMLGAAVVSAPMAASARGTNTPRYDSNYNNPMNVNAWGYAEAGTVGNAAPTGSEAARAANMQPSAGGMSQNETYNRINGMDNSRNGYSGMQSNSRKSY